MQINSGTFKNNINNNNRQSTINPVCFKPLSSVLILNSHTSTQCSSPLAGVPLCKLLIPAWLDIQVERCTVGSNARIQRIEEKVHSAICKINWSCRKNLHGILVGSQLDRKKYANVYGFILHCPTL